LIEDLAKLSDAKVQRRGSDYLNTVDEVPWRDLFNRDRQSLEWFDAQGRLLATRGELTVNDPPQTGSHTRKMESSPYQVRSRTISVFRDRNPNSSATGNTSQPPTLEGYPKITGLKPRHLWRSMLELR
jgi:hypothetical protein